MLQAVKDNALILALFALVTATLLATTYNFTKDPIAISERAAAEKALFELVPATRHDNDLLTTTLPIPEEFWSMLGLKKGGDMHVAFQDGKPVALIVPSVTQKGYSGEIQLIIGINFDGTIAGVRAVKHAETPGLGDKIELRKSNWILSFDGKSLTDENSPQWMVKKDGGQFDQFTGATITPRAVVQQVRQTLAYFQQDQQRIEMAIATLNLGATDE